MNENNMMLLDEKSGDIQSYFYFIGVTNEFIGSSLPL